MLILVDERRWHHSLLWAATSIEGTMSRDREETAIRGSFFFCFVFT